MEKAYLTIVKRGGEHHAILTSGKPLGEIKGVEYVLSYETDLVSTVSLDELWEAVLAAAEEQHITLVSSKGKKG